MSCRSHNISAPIPAAAPGNDYLELIGGHTLNITVPYTTSSGYTVKSDSVKDEHGTITVSGTQLIGFQVSRYAIEGRADERVRLTFISAETTIDGKKKLEQEKPALPFALPRGSNHARLIYLLRSSHSDHNMAIVAGKGLADVNAFTSRLIADPEVCGKAGPVFCVWVPLGIAVKQE